MNSEGLDQTAFACRRIRVIALHLKNRSVGVDSIDEE